MGGERVFGFLDSNSLCFPFNENFHFDYVNLSKGK